jgi:hypothetical protein
MQRRPADTELPGDLADALALAPERLGIHYFDAV